MPAQPDQQPGVSDAFASAAASSLSAGGNDRAGLELGLRARLARNPQDLASLERLSTLLAQQGRTGEAIEMLRRAVEIAPTDSSTRLALARMLQGRGDLEQALEQFRLLGPPVRTSFEVQTTEAGLLGMLGRHREQIEIYRKLLRKHPAEPRLWERLGNALKYSGRTSEAVRAFQQSVKLCPAYGEGWWALANVKTFRFAPGDIATMRSGLPGALDPKGAAHLNFALGTALEERGEYEESFRHYAEANRLRTMEFTPEQMSNARLAAYVDGTIGTFDQALFKRLQGAGHPATDPIFVLGLPRSGSTLVEQILASHPLIEGVAEPDAMMHVWAALESNPTSRRTVWDAIRELTPEQLHDIGADYLERIRPFRKEGRPYFVDKRPANWMYVGLIRLALPNATIIDARRNPLACGFSNFKQSYAAGALPFSYSLEGIGHYYAEYLRLMRHFDRVQAGAVHHLLNEELIDNPESEIRRLLEFAGVPFDPACLEFHKTKRAVTTASAEQVRRPINREGIDQWRHYEPWLGPLKEALGPALESWRG